jgi:hypothetical protein
MPHCGFPAGSDHHWFAERARPARCAVDAVNLPAEEPGNPAASQDPQAPAVAATPSGCDIEIEIGKRRAGISALPSSALFWGLAWMGLAWSRQETSWYVFNQTEAGQHPYRLVNRFVFHSAKRAKLIVDLTNQGCADAAHDIALMRGCARLVPFDVGHRIATPMLYARAPSRQVLKTGEYAEWRRFLDRIQLTHPTGINKAAAAWTPSRKKMKASSNWTSTTYKYSTFC